MATVKNEIGRELKVSELKTGMVVIIKPPAHDVFFTMWVVDITPIIVEFYAGTMRWHVINFIQPDGALHDDQHRPVRVFEYLGEI